MVVVKNYMPIQNPVEHLRQSAFAKITGKSRYTAFAKKASSWMFNWVLNTPLKTTQHIQCLKFFCECLMQILNSFSSQSTHLVFQFFSSFRTQFLITGRVFHAKEKESYLLYDSHTKLIQGIIFFFVHQKIRKSNCSDSACHPFSWDMSIVSAIW